MAGPGRPGRGARTHTTDAPARRLRWAGPPAAGTAGNAPQAPGSAAGDDQTARVQAAPAEDPGRRGPRPARTMAAAMQLAIALLTAGLDSPELQAWAADRAHSGRRRTAWPTSWPACTCSPVLLLSELHEVTGEP